MESGEQRRVRDDCVYLRVQYIMCVYVAAFRRKRSDDRKENKASPGVHSRTETQRPVKIARW